jgi:eukaryotic-like serine/threonine-protein kinase
VILSVFRKEAESLRGESIERYYDFLSDPDLARPFPAMEFVEGESMSGRLKSGPLSFDDIGVCCSRVAPCVQKAHSKGDHPSRHRAGLIAPPAAAPVEGKRVTPNGM